MGRDPVKNRANVARHTQRKKERQERAYTILYELAEKVKRYPINTDDGEFRGYAYRVEADKDFEERFAAWAKEHGRTSREMLDESMVVYLDEVRRLKDEQN